MEVRFSPADIALQSRFSPDRYSSPTKNDSLLKLQPRRFDGSPNSGDFLRNLSLDVSTNHMYSSTIIDSESKLKFELEKSKLDLLHHCQTVEEELRSELKAFKEFHDKQMKEKEEIITNLALKLKETTNTNEIQLTERQSSWIKEKHSLETEFERRIEDMKTKHNDAIRLLQERTLLESSAKDLNDKAKLESKEEKLRLHYDKKIRKYESQVEEVMTHYQKKELVLQGSLEEARREVNQMKTNFDARELLLREELALKDKRLLTAHSKISGVDEFITAAEIWRNAAKDLSTIVLKTCSTVHDLPDIPVPGADLLTAILESYYEEDDRRDPKRREKKEYRNMKRHCVIVHKKNLAKALRTSKKIIERIKAEIIPQYEF